MKPNAQAQAIQRTWRELLKTEKQLILTHRNIRRNLRKLKTPMRDGDYQGSFRRRGRLLLPPISVTPEPDGKDAAVRRQCSCLVSPKLKSELPLTPTRAAMGWGEGRFHHCTKGKRGASLLSRPDAVKRADEKQSDDYDGFLALLRTPGDRKAFASPLADEDDEDCCVVQIGKKKASVHLQSPPCRFA